MTLDTFCCECGKRFTMDNEKAIKNFLERNIKVACLECSKKIENERFHAILYEILGVYKC